MRALVLSGGGLFGAWQAGAWAALAPSFQPDLIVGASVGSLNGYSIACGATPDDLHAMWLDESIASFSRLETNLKKMTAEHHPRIDFAVVVTDLLRMKPLIYRGDAVTWRHLAASCAVPLVLPQVKLDGRWCSDGGLLNPLPAYAAVELGATEILGLQALPRIPSLLLRPFVKLFRATLGVHPPPPPGVSITVIEPITDLGTLSDAVHFKRANIERWLEQGRVDAQASTAKKTFPL